MSKDINNINKRRKTVLKISLAVNIVFIIITIASIIFLAKNHYLPIVFQKIFGYKNDLSYIRNPVYKNSLAVYPMYQEQKNIVMLGNSLTSYANWSELLNRADVANRGINGDVTQGFISRLQYVINLQPKICFIEGGINDINNNISQAIIVENLSKVIDTLQKYHIKPVLTTVTLLAKHFDYVSPINQNKQIKELNKALLLLSKEKQISLLDLNKYVSDNDFLKPSFATEDGIHFTDKTYIVWKHEVEKILQQEGL
ncbi:MAG: hypothetical protein KF781_05570 [Chitinophagaceae bacterium]|nr:hypothetical protein [Chitinophagaceae bacterium]MCW5905987.1 hypothetical protein [Chitinophagaceae bacterium]